MRKGRPSLARLEPLAARPKLPRLERDTGINSESARVSIYIDDTDTYRETVRAAARTAKGPCRRHPQRRRMARPCHGMIAITGVVTTTTACPGETVPGCASPASRTSKPAPGFEHACDGYPFANATKDVNPEKDTADWVTGDEPMTGPQGSYLNTLAQEARREVPKNLTKAQASDLLDELQRRTGRGAE